MFLLLLLLHENMISFKLLNAASQNPKPEAPLSPSHINATRCSKRPPYSAAISLYYIMLLLSFSPSVLSETFLKA